MLQPDQFLFAFLIVVSTRNDVHMCNVVLRRDGCLCATPSASLSASRCAILAALAKALVESPARPAHGTRRPHVWLYNRLCQLAFCRFERRRSDGGFVCNVVLRRACCLCATPIASLSASRCATLAASFLHLRSVPAVSCPRWPCSFSRHQGTSMAETRFSSASAPA